MLPPSLSGALAPLRHAAARGCSHAPREATVGHMAASERPARSERLNVRSLPHFICKKTGAEPTYPPFRPSFISSSAPCSIPPNTTPPGGAPQEQPPTRKNAPLETHASLRPHRAVLTLIHFIVASAFHRKRCLAIVQSPKPRSRHLIRLHRRIRFHRKPHCKMRANNSARRQGPISIDPLT